MEGENVMTDERQSYPWLPALIEALGEWETGGEFDPNHALGDGGRSWGRWQIGQAVLDDVNRIYGAKLGVHFTRAHCFDPIIARTICELYLRYWVPRVRDPSPEIAARIWNGGPDGWRQACTLAYWQGVKAILEGTA